MIRRERSIRFAASGLLVLLQVGTIAHMSHMGCFMGAADSHAETHGAGGGHGASPMSAHHGADRTDHDRPADASDPCCSGKCVCPQLQIDTDHGARFAPVVHTPTDPAPASHHAEPALAATPHLLPFPNPPPTA